MRRNIVLIILLLTAPAVAAHAQGLKFNGQTVMIQERTSLDVFGLAHRSFRSSLEISFDFISYPSAKFGYLLRLSDYKQSETTWNVSFDNRSDSLVVQLNEEGRRSLIQICFAADEYRDYQWIPVDLCFIPAADSVYFSFAGKRVGEKLEHQNAEFAPELHFGRSGHVVDVPSFALRNLRVSGGGKSFCFPLTESEGTYLHDSKGRRSGTVTNPNWMVGAARRWEHVAAMSSDIPGGTVYSPLRKSVLLYNENSVSCLGIENGSSSTVPCQNPVPCISCSAQISCKATHSRHMS